jgi:predicted DCC family thiol-disulfide oxidoreductase YuxK
MVEQKLFATINTPPRFQMGDEMGFAVERADLHLFDENGDRLPDEDAVSLQGEGK